MISRLVLGSVRSSRPGLRFLGYAVQSGGRGVTSLHERQYPSMQWYHSTGYVRDSGNSLTFLERGEVSYRVLTAVKNFEKVESSKVMESSKFKEDLGLDSLDAVEVVMSIEDEFSIEIPDANADKMLCSADAIEFIVAHPQAK